MIETERSLLDFDQRRDQWQLAGEIEAPQGNYDYHSKYFSDETKYFCPAGLPEAKELEIRAMSLRAFEVDAADYLTKPVRLERLRMALKKAEQRMSANKAEKPEKASNFVLIHDRGRTERVPLADIVYLRAELKYVTVRTAERTLIYDGSLAEFEERHGAHWLRIHRNALVARHAIRTLEKHHDAEEGDGWAVRLVGVGEALAVSRRQLAAVRDALGKG